MNPCENSHLLSNFLIGWCSFCNDMLNRMCSAVWSVQLCISRREILTSAERCVRRPSMLAERTGKTTDKLQSEFCKKSFCSCLFLTWENLHTLLVCLWAGVFLNSKQIWKSQNIFKSGWITTCIKQHWQGKLLKKEPLGGSIAIFPERDAAVMTQKASSPVNDHLLLRNWFNWSEFLFWLVGFWVVFSLSVENEWCQVLVMWCCDTYLFTGPWPGLATHISSRRSIKKQFNISTRVWQNIVLLMFWRSVNRCS